MLLHCITSVAKDALSNTWISGFFASISMIHFSQYDTCKISLFLLLPLKAIIGYRKK